MKVNDRVVCIDVGKINKLNLYQTYTIENILDERDNCAHQISLKEIENKYYKIERFITLQEYRKYKLKLICQKYL